MVPSKLSSNFRRPFDVSASRRMPLILVTLLAMAGSLCGQHLTGQPGSSSSSSNLRGQFTSDIFSATESAPARLRLREGTVILDKLGTFGFTEDHISFHEQEDDLQLAVLENLALERIVRVIGESHDPGEVEWKVSGTVTEFQGKNYLLLSKAVVISR